MAHPSTHQSQVSLTRRAATLGTLAFVGASALAFPAAAQEVLSDAQCRIAKGAVIRTLEEFRGKMSAEFATSLGTFAKTCSLDTTFNRVPGQDDRAWDTFRVRINVIRTSAAAPTNTLAKN
jgi:hypothetical protein